jgi:hydrogenase expression/formation protein HypC
VVEITDGMAKVEVEGVSRMVSTMMVPELKLGDYIIAHAGFALHVVDEKDALESIELLKELAQAMPQEEQGR